MGDTPSACRNARCSEPAARAVRENYRPPDDQRPRYALKVRDGHHCGDRTRRSSPGGSSRGHHRFPYDDPQEGDLDLWLERACASLVASFANGVIKDKAAVNAAITTSWSNGQTEGQITKLKLVKRQLYGRAKLDLLQARLIGVI